MTKWFDTNYHYLVPRLARKQVFTLTENRPLEMFREAQAASLRTRPVLLGPVSFLRLAKTADGSDPLDLLDQVLPVYARVLRELAEAGCAWVQIDEPVLALDLPEKAQLALALAYGTLVRGEAPDILLASYFGAMGDNLGTALRLPVAGLHLDLVRGASDLDAVLEAASAEQWLSLGLVDGRNVWRTDLRAALTTAQRVAAARGSTRRLMVAPSCSLLHVPVDLAQETRLAPEIKNSLAFATQKLGEVAALARGLDDGEAAIRTELEASDAAARSRRTDPRVNRPEVAARLAAVTPSMERRATPVPRPPRQAAGAARPAALSHDHHRLLPADRQRPPDARGARTRRDDRGRVRAGDRGLDRRGRALAGGHRPRRAGARRVRA